VGSRARVLALEVHGRSRRPGAAASAVAGACRTRTRCRPAMRSCATTSSRSRPCPHSRRTSATAIVVTAVSRLGFDKVKSDGRDDLPRSSSSRVPRTARGAAPTRARSSMRPAPTRRRTPWAPAVFPSRASTEPRPHHLRHPRRARTSARALRRPAHAGPRQRAFRLQRTARSRVAEDGGAGHADHVGDAAQRDRTPVRRRRTDALPARGSLGAKLRQLVNIGVIDIVTGFRAQSSPEGIGRCAGARR
jgi:hypothetical protein